MPLIRIAGLAPLFIVVWVDRLAGNGNLVMKSTPPMRYYWAVDEREYLSNTRRTCWIEPIS